MDELVTNGYDHPDRHKGKAQSDQLKYRYLNIRTTAGGCVPIILLTTHPWSPLSLLLSQPGPSSGSLRFLSLRQVFQLLREREPENARVQHDYVDGRCFRTIFSCHRIVGKEEIFMTYSPALSFGVFSSDLDYEFRCLPLLAGLLEVVQLGLQRWKGIIP